MSLIQLAEQGATAGNDRGISLVIVAGVVLLLGVFFVPRFTRNSKQFGAGIILVAAFIVCGIFVVVVSTRG